MITKAVSTRKGIWISEMNELPDPTQDPELLQW
jgi:hypothetical protein